MEGGSQGDRESEARAPRFDCRYTETANPGRRAAKRQAYNARTDLRGQRLIAQSRPGTRRRSSSPTNVRRQWRRWVKARQEVAPQQLSRRSAQDEETARHSRREVTEAVITARLQDSGASTKDAGRIAGSTSHHNDPRGASPSADKAGRDMKIAVTTWGAARSNSRSRSRTSRARCSSRCSPHATPSSRRGLDAPDRLVGTIQETRASDWIEDVLRPAAA